MRKREKRREIIDYGIVLYETRTTGSQDTVNYLDNRGSPPLLVAVNYTSTGIYNRDRENLS